MRKLASALGAAFILATTAVIGAPSAAASSPDYTSWVDLGIVYTAQSGDAYYPSVIYDPAGFGTGTPLYRMWYSDGGGNVFVVSATDGVAWARPRPRPAWVAMPTTFRSSTTPAPSV